MSNTNGLKNKLLFQKIKILSNRQRFRILEITQIEEPSVSEISRKLNLSYSKCADYISLLEKNNLVEKRKEGKEVKIRSKIQISDNGISLIQK